MADSLKHLLESYGIYGGSIIVAFIAAHPGCRRAALVSAFADAVLATLRRALDVARAGGRIRMDGMRRTARYFPIASPRTERTSAADDVALESS